MEDALLQLQEAQAAAQLAAQQPAPPASDPSLSEAEACAACLAAFHHVDDLMRHAVMRRDLFTTAARATLKQLDASLSKTLLQVEQILEEQGMAPYPAGQRSRPHPEAVAAGTVPVLQSGVELLYKEAAELSGDVLLGGVLLAMEMRMRAALRRLEQLTAAEVDDAAGLGGVSEEAEAVDPAVAAAAHCWRCCRSLALSWTLPRASAVRLHFRCARCGTCRRQ